MGSGIIRCCCAWQARACWLWCAKTSSRTSAGWPDTMRLGNGRGGNAACPTDLCMYSENVGQSNVKQWYFYFPNFWWCHLQKLVPLPRIRGHPGSSRVIQGPWQGPLAGLDVVRLLGLSVDAAAWLSIESGGGRFQGHPVKKTETVKEQSQPVDPIDKTQSTLVSLLDHPVESSFNFFICLQFLWVFPRL